MISHNCRSAIVAVSLAVVVVVGASACSDDDAADTTVPVADPVETDLAAPNDSTTTAALVDDTAPAESGIVDVDVAPGTAIDGYVGAADDVGEVACSAGDGGRIASGTVTNPTDGLAGYRIYVSFLDEESETAALVQADVAEVGSGASTDWSAVAAIDDGEYTCVLRVERYTP